MFEIIFISVVAAIVLFFIAPTGRGALVSTMKKLSYVHAPISIWENRPTTYGDDLAMFESAVKAVHRLGEFDNNLRRGYKSPDYLVKLTKRSGKLSPLCGAIILIDLLRQKNKSSYLIPSNTRPLVLCNTYTIDVVNAEITNDSVESAQWPPSMQLLSAEDVEARIVGV